MLTRPIFAAVLSAPVLLPSLLLLISVAPPRSNEAWLVGGLAVYAGIIAAVSQCRMSSTLRNRAMRRKRSSSSR